MCNKIAPNRERKVIPEILKATMNFIEKANVSFMNQDSTYIKDIFKNILISI